MIKGDHIDGKNFLLTTGTLNLFRKLSA